MKRECSIVRDMLPLYAEGMVSDETATFIKEHLEKCAECSAEFETIANADKINEIAPPTKEQGKQATHALAAFRKRLRKKALLIIAITATCVVGTTVLLHFFPVYLIMQVKDLSYYSGDEIAKLIYIGSRTDRASAQSILRQADAAFHDWQHTDTENEERYGLLARYATPVERDVSFTIHSLELWSAHLGTSDGYLWVYYSYEAFDSQGNTVTGSWNIPSFWHVQKNDTGEWVVVSIKEKP